MEKVIALIPLRGGSKGIPKKNIKILAGKPLCAWVLEAACRSEVFNGIYVSTDSEEIAGVVNGLGLPVTVIDRPRHLATDEATTDNVILDTIKRYPCRTITTLQATSPQTTYEDIRGAWDKFNKGYDSLFSAYRTKLFLWSDSGKPLNHDPRYQRLRRQDIKGTLAENGAIYIAKSKIVEKYHNRFGGRIGYYEMDSGLDIDRPEDWVAAERVLYERKEICSVS